ncbi:hypothetical protein DENSPDRAFT_841031 [Dentipellis sp. KUC8613]|nr:hypothetical protein DENSPDRAFT_841031 [Dentipellis sp. KUC8613]
MPRIESESFVVDARPQYPLLISVKRYWSPGFDATDDDALTLVLTHAVGSHNEQWEPVLEELYGVNATASSISKYSFKVREAWAIECPNHGEGALLNEEKLKTEYASVFPVEDYARAIHVVLSGRGEGLNIDFKSRRLVGVGHSLGATALILSRMIQPTIPWLAAVLIEPLLLSSEVDKAYRSPLAALAAENPDVWPDREEALKTIKSGSSKSWDPRVLELYVSYGLREVSIMGQPKNKIVTLKCSKSQEAATYRGVLGSSNALAYLPTFCSNVPVYVVLGSKADYLPANNSSNLVEKDAGRKFKGVVTADGEGHFVLQTNPQAVAENIYTSLIQAISTSQLKTKL